MVTLAAILLVLLLRLVYQSPHLSPWLRLVRWPNLLIIAGTQYVAWAFIIQGEDASVLTPENFRLLCFSTMLIAAGGYIINDYFDVRIDVINKPGKVVLEKEIPRKRAIIAHSVVNILAIAMAGMVAIPAGHPEWLLLQLACTGLLWRYSTTWKRQFMIGNVVVALMTALTIGALILYEPAVRNPPTENYYHMRPLKNAVWILGIFMCFAFVLTWMREVVKDMQDYKGDDAEGCITMPIQWGLLRTTRFVQGLGLAVFLLLLLCGFALVLNNYIVTPLIVAAEMYLLIRWLIELPKHADTVHYSIASRKLKHMMVVGLIIVVVFGFSNFDFLPDTI